MGTDGKDCRISEEELARYRDRGYNDDLLPKSAEKRNMSSINYFTLWMGSVHNIPNYAAVGGFLFLGLSPVNVMIALVISALLVSLFMASNGEAGSRYGIPFAMHLRSTYGNLGAKAPGIIRGVIVAIAWFGLQNYTGSLALTIIISKVWPGFLSLGGGATILGISVPGLISFTIFWLLNVAIGLGGGGILNKFTGILSPVIYIVIFGMTAWAIWAAGGLAPIFAYSQGEAGSVNPAFIYLMIFSSVLAVWAAPGASVSDFTQNAESTRSQQIGQSAGLIVGYMIFAFCSVVILLGSSIAFNVQEWDITKLINRWDSLPAVIFATLLFLFTTISTNATGNIIPAAYQLSALFPKRVTYKKGVIIASIVSFAIMPWNLMANSASIYEFLNFVGAFLGPVAGVMIAHYYFVTRRTIDLNALYMDVSRKDSTNPYAGIRWEAIFATLAGLVISYAGKIIPALKSLTDISWIVGFASALIIYTIIMKVAARRAGQSRFSETR
ncbi:permease for cytosine/purines uracil thiamine allantoin [Coriobacterium glomerans PW2]|uniref:Permease for cytosine/purines uracil thiamine allantoin n=1 Tax=Coriobacterium glomerans (strain ATCC 49209 / DSM 20642 / JCM 10262 / PW2) TaxID=700015 RepID=F2N959_CORGP|nr:putative allantoin permease [Coriobacterium glomerans]AEB07735.1 permease for cytosine/purines uracil thiamine allantoin [Coriobacterium glomerans PW2]